MPTVTSRSLRQAIERDRARVQGVLARYGATNPRLFGSVARDDAVAGSDVDLLVDLDPAGGNVLLRDLVAVSAHADAVPLCVAPRLSGWLTCSPRSTGR